MVVRKQMGGEGELVRCYRCRKLAPKPHVRCVRMPGVRVLIKQALFGLPGFGLDQMPVSER